MTLRVFGGAGGGGPSWEQLRIRALGGAFGPRYHACGQITGSGGTNLQVIGINQLVAVPIVIGRPCLLDRLAFEIRAPGAAGSVARVGLYTSGDMYPAQLVVDGGEQVSTSAGIKESPVFAPPFPLPAGIYWGVYLTGIAVPSVGTIFKDQCFPFGGVHTGAGTFNIAHGTCWSIVHAYGALPAVFPGTIETAIPQNIDPPGVYLRLA